METLVGEEEEEEEGEEERERGSENHLPPPNMLCGPESREGQTQEQPEEKRFMVYICGGYTDSVAERRALMESVYPRLYLHCKQRGYDFSMVDLRAGVKPPAAERHDTVELHVDNVQRCQRTRGANFILFVGQKHEVRGPPSTIRREAFEGIVSVLERDDQLSSRSKAEEFKDSSCDSFIHDSMFRSYLSFGDDATNSGALSRSSSSSPSEEEEDSVSPAGATSPGGLEDVTLLHTCYKLDENFLPPVYRLLPISSLHPDMLSTDTERRKQAGTEWSATCLRLWATIRRSAEEAVGQEEAAMLLRTVLDWEVEAGLQAAGEAPPEEHCHCYKRLIPDLHSNLQDQRVCQYADVLKGRAQLDPVLGRAQQQFMARLHKKLRHTNIYEWSVCWARRGLNPEHDRSHRFYTERISSHCQRTVISSLNKVMKVSRPRGPFETVRRETIRAQTQEEIQLQVNYGLHLAQGCTLRQAVLADVKKAVLQSRSRPVLLLGPPGWGKSSTLAAVAQLASSWLPGDVKILLHFCGLTGASRNVRLLLQSLCVQLAEAYRPHTQLSQGLPQLITELHSLLGLVGAERPLVVLLDGLDELSEEHGADLSWITSPLPPDVHLILSATTGSPCTHTLQATHPTVLSLPPLSPDDITAALETKLRSDRRCLQEHQRQLLLQACLTCPCPLYLEAAYSESRLWTSYSPQAGLSLPHSLEGLYVSMLARLERELGKELVRRAASLISASRWGITEEELLYLLARDKKVLQEVTPCYSSSSPPKVPYVLWARLKRDLGRHLSEVRTDGTWVYRWAHSELSRVCTCRYLKTEDSRTAVHADYAAHYRHKSEHTHIFQPLAWTLEEEEEGGGVTKSYRFNLRKLHGLPYHLLRSGQILPLLSECIFNYEFLLHKAWGLSVLDVEEDLKRAVLPDTELVDVEVLSGALEMSRSVLLQDPCQLASQLTGRLGQMIIEDHPVAKGDPLKFSYLHDLLDQCTKSSLPVLLPSSTCLLPPGGLQPTLLAGHLTNVTALGAGQRGPLAVTSESDGSLRFWDLERRRIIRSLEAAGGVVADSVTLGLDDRMLILRMGPSLQVREAESGRVVYSESDSVDVPIITTTDGGKLLVVFYDGSRLVKVFDLSSSCSLLHSANISMEREAIHKDRSILLSNSSVRDYVLFAYRSGGEAAVLSAREGRVLSVLSAQLGAASIQAVETSEDYLLLFCRYPYKSSSEIIHIELFSSVSFLYLRSILGCSQDHISQVSVNRAGSHVVAFCPSPRTGLTELVTWNLETEDHKHIARLPAVLTKGVCSDLSFCVGICRGDRYLHLWDLSSRIRDQTLTFNIHKVRSDGTEQVIPVGKNRRYAVCRSLRPGSVSVWNLTRRRFLCRPVRAEHGLFSSTDVALIHDFTLFILTDRSTNGSRDADTGRFQTLLVYDLIRRSYVRRLMGLSVIPCPQQEFHLLQDGRTLLGLSETRGHVILWDLESGSIKHEIKPKHRESQVCSGLVRDLQPDVTSGREKAGRVMVPPRICWSNFQISSVMPWDVRTESRSAKKKRQEREKQRDEERKRRLDREKYNSIDQYVLSGDGQVLVCSYFAHHLDVFSLASRDHLHTLEDHTSLLSLHTAAVTQTGSHLVLTHYDQDQRAPNITLWDLSAGTVRRTVRSEAGVCCVALTDDAERVVFGVAGSNRLNVWDPFKRKSRSICGHQDLKIQDCSELYITERGSRAVLLSGQLSLWDLEACSVLSVLSLDAHVSCLKLLHGQEVSVLLGLSHSPALTSVRSTSRTVGSETEGPEDADLFGESSSSEEEEEDT